MPKPSDQIPGLRRQAPNPNAPTVPWAQPFVPENPNPEKDPYAPVSPEDKLNAIADMHQQRMQADMQAQGAQQEAAMQEIRERQPAAAPYPMPADLKEQEPAEGDLPSMQAVLAMIRRPKPQPKSKK